MSAAGQAASGHSSSLRTGVLAGIAFMVVGTSLLPVMNTFAKSLAAEFPLWQVTWARFTGHVLLMALVFVPVHGIGVLRSGHLPLQLTRSIVFFVSNACFIGGLPWVSLAVASCIMFTVPMIVTAVSVLFLGERVGVWRWGAVALGFAGAVIIVRPGGASFEPATLLILASACCYSVYQLLTRRLANVDSPQTQIIWTALVGAVVTSFMIPFIGRLPESGEQIWFFLALGTFGSVAHLLVIQALKRGSASVMSPIGYVELIGAATLGYLVFGDVPDALTWLGALLIVGSGLVIAWREGRTRASSGTVGAQPSSGIGLSAFGVVLIALALAAYIAG